MLTAGKTRAEDDTALRLQLEDTTRALVREKGMNAEREQELIELRAQLTEERKQRRNISQERKSEAELVRLGAQLEVKEEEVLSLRKAVQELERQRVAAGEKEGAVKKQLEKLEKEREAWKRVEEERVKVYFFVLLYPLYWFPFQRFEAELAEAQQHAKETHDTFERERAKIRVGEQAKDKEIARLRKQVDAEREHNAREKEDTSERSKALQSESEGLRSQIQERDLRIESLLAQVGELESSITVLRTGNETLSSQVCSLEQEIERTRKETENVMKEQRDKDGISLWFSAL